LWTLENLVEGNVVNRITVAADEKEQALIALDQMLQISP
jgi:quinolinate synthase